MPLNLGSNAKLFLRLQSNPRKRAPNMSSLSGRLQELRLYWVKILPH